MSLGLARVESVSINQLDAILLQRLLTKGDFSSVLIRRQVCSYWKFLIDSWLVQRAVVRIPPLFKFTSSIRIVPRKLSFKRFILNLALEYYQPPFSRAIMFGDNKVDLRNVRRDVLLEDMLKLDGLVPKVYFNWGDRFAA